MIMETLVFLGVSRGFRWFDWSETNETTDTCNLCSNTARDPGSAWGSMFSFCLGHGKPGTGSLGSIVSFPHHSVFEISSIQHELGT